MDLAFINRLIAEKETEIKALKLLAQQFAPPETEAAARLDAPLAKSLADMVTPKQLGMIRHLAKEAGVDADEECRRVNLCLTDELNKKAASSFIDHLKSLQQTARRA